MSQDVEKFIARWQGAGGTERANYQLFLTELTALLGLDKPDPAGDDTRDNAYVFERRVTLQKPDGTTGSGFIDLYKRGCFVCEAKQTGKTLDSSGWDKAMLRAQNQADQYARALPADEGRPPFIVVTDVGRSLELYAEFSRSGATYTPFPDALTHRIRLEDLRDEAIRDRLKAVWTAPLSLDPARESARVTRDIADRLAKLAKSLEAKGHPPETVAAFLMRAMFTMFAEDVGLIRERSFTELLESLRGELRAFVPMVEGLWREMNQGGYSVALRAEVLRFNGGLFAEPRALAIDRDQLELLIDAAHADWRYVEPAIFGTLLERALDPRERHKLGAHYTPRAYVERLVLPTVIEPLRAEWREVQAAALAFEQKGKRKGAIAEVEAFRRHLSSVRVLDPACGSANFLYVTLEHMKRLEGEVLNLLHDLGVSQRALGLEGFTVSPDQFLGLEINPRAARIAEMVLWIGYLQWHFRTHGSTNPPEPVLQDFHNIECRDALLDYDAEELVRGEDGKPITRWDGVTFKKSPVTGKDIPDEAAQAIKTRYVNPRKAEWPKAEFIVGNPPFIGNKRMRAALGDGYVEALRASYGDVPASADFVMYWWHIAAAKVAACDARRAGLISTNSITQTFNRAVVRSALESKTPVSIAFAVPNHPWVDSGDGADVRIAMTVVASGEEEGRLLAVQSESGGVDGSVEVALAEKVGRIHSDLRVGADVTAAKPLEANHMLSFMGVILVGQGFVVEPGDPLIASEPGALKPYLVGNELNRLPKQRRVIDFFGMTAEEARSKYPRAYQRVLERVKPERDHNAMKKRRERWWLHGSEAPEMREAIDGLSTIIAICRTAKHFIFQFVPGDVIVESTIIAIALDEAWMAGILSSRVHIGWALAQATRLGVGNDPRYNNSRCFETFPFPTPTPEQRARIGALAEEIDALRKKQQEEHADVTLTGLYNVLEKLRAEEALTPKERELHEKGLVSVLRELHDALDAAVFEAYGWPDLAPALVGRPGATTPHAEPDDAQAEAEEELLARLVALNAERAAEEERGLVRWLRPALQAPGEAPAADQAALEGLDRPAAAPAGKKKREKKSAWPKEMRAQVAAVRAALERGAATPEGLAERFKRSPTEAVGAVLEALEELGMVHREGDAYRLAA